MSVIKILVICLKKRQGKEGYTIKTPLDYYCNLFKSIFWGGGFNVFSDIDFWKMHKLKIFFYFEV